MRRLLALAVVAGLAGCGAPRDLGLDGIFSPPEKPKDGSLMDTKPNPPAPVAPMTTTVKKAEAPAAKKTDAAKSKDAKKPAADPAKPKTEEEIKKDEAKKIAP